MKKILTLAITFSLILSLLCGSALAAEPEDLIGTWHLTSIETMGFTFDPVAFKVEMTLVLREDYTVLFETGGELIAQSLEEDEQSVEGEWALRGDQLILFDDGSGSPDSGMAFTVSGDGLVLEEEEVLMFFIKAGAETKPAVTLPTSTAAPEVQKLAGVLTIMDVEFVDISRAH